MPHRDLPGSADLLLVIPGPENENNSVLFQHSCGELDQMNLLSWISFLRTKESWSAFDTGFVPNYDRRLPSEGVEVLTVSFFITVRADIPGHVPNEENHGDDTYSLPISDVPGMVLGAGNAAGTWHEPSGPDRHSMANEKQLIQGLHYDPCSKEAS